MGIYWGYEWVILSGLRLVDQYSIIINTWFDGLYIPFSGTASGNQTWQANENPQNTYASDSFAGKIIQMVDFPATFDESGG